MITYFVQSKGNGAERREMGQRTKEAQGDFDWWIVGRDDDSDKPFIECECKYKKNADGLCTLLNGDKRNEYEQEIARLTKEGLIHRSDRSAS